MTLATFYEPCTILELLDAQMYHFYAAPLCGCIELFGLTPQRFVLNKVVSQSEDVGPSECFASVDFKSNPYKNKNGSGRTQGFRQKGD